MCSTEERDKIVKDFVNRPAHVTAAAFSASVGVHWTTIYGWVRKAAERKAAFEPARSDGYKAVQASLHVSRRKVAHLDSELTRIKAEQAMAVAEVAKLEQALTILS